MARQELTAYRRREMLILMKVTIVHDSELGNGERLAEAMRERLQAAGHTVVVGHERTMTPEQTLRAQPDLIILGTAVRKFSLSPVTKRWVDGFSAAIAAGGPSPRAAIFVTHALKREGTERKGKRIRDRLVAALSEDQVYPGWISARVIGTDGPFQQGVEVDVMREIDAVLAWVAT